MSSPCLERAPAGAPWLCSAGTLLSEKTQALWQCTGEQETLEGGKLAEGKNAWACLQVDNGN